MLNAIRISPPYEVIVSPVPSPHSDFDRLLAVVLRLKTDAVSWQGHAYRVVGPRYLSPADIISGIGAMKGGGRWNPVGLFRTVYASLTPEAATAEALAHNRHYGIPDYQQLPRVLVSLEVSLAQVLDLTDAHVRRRVKTSLVRMMAEDWRAAQDAGQEALTQAIGRAAFEAGYEGMLVPSRSVRSAVNIALFVEQLKPTSRLDVLNPDVLLRLSGT